MTLRPLPTAMFTPLRSAAVALVLLAAKGLALAHDGHGMEGSHWHASDLLGLVVGLAVAALTWRSGKDR